MTGLDDGNTDAVVEIVVGSTGTDETNAPYAPQALRATAVAGGDVRVEWSYPYLDVASRPTGFKVYRGTGGTVSYTSPVATVAYGGSLNQNYRTTVTGQTDGVEYVFGVRSYNAHGEETNTTKVTVTADATAPSGVQALTATVV